MDQDHAVQAYAELAPEYDRFTAAHNHEAWAQTLEAVAIRHGLRGRRMLDVACGTGNSLLPFVDRGYEAVGCDITPAMLELAARKAQGRADLFVSDVRRLPADRRYDLVLCVGDVLNYLLEPAEVEAAFISIARVLAPAGRAVFDVNTLGAYRSTFSTSSCFEDAHGLIAWRGRADRETQPGARVESVVDVFTAENGHWRRSSSRHLHRHHPDELIRETLRRARLTPLASYGVTRDGRVHDEVEELAHSKRLYVVARS